MGSSNFKSKIFVTGLFGSGKTHFSKKFVEKNGDYKFISFDKNYPYHDPDKGIKNIFKLIENGDKLIMDAVPPENPIKSFEDYYLNNNCTIILVECGDIDVWLGRLKSKYFYKEENLDEYKKNYKDFYSKWVDDNLVNSHIRGDFYIYDNSIDNEPIVP
tara:strand:- start:27789 stop:28265 length:477 start_codon:yes stop_codon:yes gene_type:complete